MMVTAKVAIRSAVTSVRDSSVDEDESKSRRYKVLVALTGLSSAKHRYSIDKLRSFQNYRLTVSWWRVAGVILFMPLPSLVCASFLSLIPLQDPHDRITENPGFIVHVTILLWFSAIGSILHPRAALGFSNSDYSFLEVLTVSTITAVLTGALIVLIGHLWRFPIPFMIAVIFTPWSMILSAAHIVVLRDRLTKSEKLRGPAMAVQPWLTVQNSQILIYPAISAAFDAVNKTHQVLLMLLFPIVKFILKRLLRRMGKVFRHDFMDEMAISSVEISACLYQSMVMQSSPSTAAAAIIIAVDVIQGLLAIKLFLEKPSFVPHDRIVPHAFGALDHYSIQEDDLVGLSQRETDQSSRTKTRKVVNSILKATGQVGESSIAPLEIVAAIQSTSSTTLNKAASITLVWQALHIAQAAETILLVEYFEVAIPIVNAAFFALASQLPSARYHKKLWPVHGDASAVWLALQSPLLYVLLQGVTVVAMMLVMRFRYNLSAAKFLAFVLERHAWSLQGKLIGWLPVMLHFSLVHYGVDFSFRFNVDTMMPPP